MAEAVGPSGRDRDPPDGQFEDGGPLDDEAADIGTRQEVRARFGSVLEGWFTLPGAGAGVSIRGSERLHAAALGALGIAGGAVAWVLADDPFLAAVIWLLAAALVVWLAPSPRG
jgi:hypothetical protein